MGVAFDFSPVHSTWKPIVTEALKAMDQHYLQALMADTTWLPGTEKIFRAFSLPLPALTAILFGESPYPRQTSANGYAFWDAAVHDLWSPTGLSTAVNRATSLRNLIKALLVASGRLNANNTSQAAIAALDKTSMVQTLDALFGRLQAHGILLLNASLVFRPGNVTQDARAWLPFMASLLSSLHVRGHAPTLWLFGRIAERIVQLPAAAAYPKIVAEHPYNLSFVQNKGILSMLQPLHLLEKQ